jgi:hypothetical protein
LQDGPKAHRDLAYFEPEKPDLETVKEPQPIDGPALAPLADTIHMMRSLTTSVNLAGDDGWLLTWPFRDRTLLIFLFPFPVLADLSHIFHIQLTTTPPPSPAPIFSEVLAVVSAEFPYSDAAPSIFLKRAPFDDYAWILTINDKNAAEQFASRFLPKPAVDDSAEMETKGSAAEVSLVGGAWKVATMREYKDSKFGYRKRSAPEDAGPNSQAESSQRKKAANGGSQ